MTNDLQSHATPQGVPRSWAGWKRHLSSPVDASPVVFFRFMFGLIMMWEVFRYFQHGWIGRYFIDPDVHLTYRFFSWVQPWPGDFMYLHFGIMGVLALGIAVGYRYRLCTSLFFLAFTYVFLLEKARYLNHFYLICLISFLLIFIPANRYFAQDAKNAPHTRTPFVPLWSLWLLRFQIGIAYFYGGVAKINQDWLRGEPMRFWLGNRVDFPIIGPLFTEEWVIYLFSYGGLIFDLLVVPLLLWRKTQALTFLVTLGFHITNSQLFSIGIFPWFMIVASTLFFDPDWLRNLFRRSKAALPETASTAFPRYRLHTGIALILGLHVALQVLVPLRHFCYPTYASWSEEGHRFAWHMKLRQKTGKVKFKVTDKVSGEEWIVNPRDHLKKWQYRKMAHRPDMILEFSHYLSRYYREHEDRCVEVRALAKAKLNGRKYQTLIDPEVDLIAQEMSFLPYTWIRPLED